MLPGVVEAGEDSVEYLATHEELVVRLVQEAIAKLNEMRQREGAALWADLQKHVEIIRTSLAEDCGACADGGADLSRTAAGAGESDWSAMRSCRCRTRIC